MKILFKKICLTELCRIERDIIEAKKELERLTPGATSTQWVSKEKLHPTIELLKNKITRLESSRQFILDRRNNLFWKIIWNIIIPIIVSSLTSILIINYFSKP